MDAFFFEFYEALYRQGPGDSSTTARAFNLLKDLPKNPEIIDIGCGMGAQTLDLATLSPGHITSVDNHEFYIAKLKEYSKEKGLDSQITPIIGDMGALKFPDGTFDLVWSEGAAFVIGLEKAIVEWKRLLKPRGYMVISDCMWFRKDPPAELKAYWDRVYPDLMHSEDFYFIIKKAGYELIDSFNMPAELWWKAYYTPMEQRAKELEEKYKGDQAKLKRIDEMMEEVRVFKQYSDYYGYTFYVMRRIDQCSHYFVPLGPY
eukprot:TRINITY_DN855_c0_g3_i1.p1 TRINITY_DN855_c0_g3~~TRINITY_DN855_c0_g3_i1.p1  ORF type:complete len:304 (-),score=23.56 TRINITY_DN855_c0_g3_i1:56-835(-)